MREYKLVRSLFSTQLEADAWLKSRSSVTGELVCENAPISVLQQQSASRLLQMELDFEAPRIEMELAAKLAATTKSEQLKTAVHGCQTKAEYIAEVVAHDRANDPPELYWRFRFAEAGTEIASVQKVASGGAGGIGRTIVETVPDGMMRTPRGRLIHKETWDQWRDSRGKKHLRG